ncbi:MAG: cytidyltransferase [Peptostreptococcaceae bacterium]|nr:cytidyltransferase [Peptostreptococcaceae bacterium]
MKNETSFKRIFEQLNGLGISYSMQIPLPDETMIRKIQDLMEKRDWSAYSLLSILENYFIDICSSCDLSKDHLEDERSKKIFEKDHCPDKKSFLEYTYDHIRHRCFPESVQFDPIKWNDFFAKLFLIFFQEISYHETTLGGDRFYNRFPMCFLDGSEEKELLPHNEYFTFKKHFKEDYIFEMLKLSQEVKGYTTLDHISGVCYIALFIARQLKSRGVPIDLGIVVSASMGHDLGKYGAKKSEEKRIPYLHYYYTDLWFKKRSMPFSGKVAANHSTWDLELENLQIESLVLIYADFRVKALGSSMHIYDLSDSFQVILDKLDNVDEAKERRYKRVYAKLKDFENYMIDMGIETDPLKAISMSNDREQKDFPFMYGDQIVDNIKFQSINYNINILKNFSSFESFNDLLLKLSSEKNGRELRNYIVLFQEYDKYLGKEQKILLFNVLQDLLLFREEDVRNQVAEVIGIMIANFDEEYRKEIPDSVSRIHDEQTSVDVFDRFLNYLLYKDHKQTDKNIEWLRINSKNMVQSLFLTTTKPEIYHEVILRHLQKAIGAPDPGVVLALTQILKHIRYDRLNIKDGIHAFLDHFYDHSNVEIRFAISKLIYIMAKYSIAEEQDIYFARKMIEQTKQDENKVLNHLRIKMIRELGKHFELQVDEVISLLNKDFINKQDVVEIYLKNLKSATGWIEKKANIDIMVDFLLQGKTQNDLQTALHFCNLLKVSSTESVRNHSGKSIVKIIGNLQEQEKNEVAIELIRALEMQDIQFTKYIPKYAGQVIVHLEPNELDEILDDFYVKVKTSPPQLTWLVLMAVGYCVEEYLSCGYTKDQVETHYIDRMQKMLGILMIGLYSFDLSISNDSLKIIARLFSSKRLSLDDKRLIFEIIDKRLLNIIGEKISEENIFINNSASLNKIYRFISDYEFFEGKLVGKNNHKIAFFPGSFDPFSLGHKAIVKEIRKQGYDVFLAIDEFSWSKKTQPNEIRKNIIKCSIADEMNIYVFPNKYPINIANDKDIIKLKALFPDKELSIVVGSDVVKNASSYLEGKNGEILDLDHIIFHRKMDDEKNGSEDDLPVDKINNIKGRIEILNLPPQYESISSTRIRESIDENRDISELIDHQAQSYIYRFSLYKKAPRDKFFAPKSGIKTEIYDPISAEEAKIFIDRIPGQKYYDLNDLFNDDHKKELKLVALKNEEDENIIAFATGFWLKSPNYYHEFKNPDISEYLRNKAMGRIFVINSLWVKKHYPISHLGQIMLTEILAMAIEKDYSFCVYHDPLNDDQISEVLKNQGFVEIEQSDGKPKVYGVNMSNPIVLNPDLRSIVKDPFRNNENIRKVIYHTRERLQRALTKLYPGELVLAFDRKMTYSKLVKKVCEINSVSIIPVKPRKLGDKICVSYGTILNETIVPNTVTKSLHTEKVFRSDLGSFDIEQYPNYMDLSIQIETIKSFDRPVILIDDILHKGYRIQKMWPLFKEKKVEIDHLVVAILSGRGQEILQQHGREVEYIYYLKNLRNWFNENAMYPFIGGDYVKREGQKEHFLLPSLNYILPYAYPHFIKGARTEDIYNLSEVCIENAILFFEAIEREYQKINEKTFSLFQLREVFEKTRRPDYGKNVELDLNTKPSVYLKNDLENLRRLKNMFVNTKN